MAVRREYILKLLRDAHRAMSKVPSLRRVAEEVWILLEKVEKGEVKPEIYELEPGTVVNWVGREGYPYTEVRSGEVTHNGELGSVSSIDVHRGNEFHVLGRVLGALVYGFTAIKYNEKGEPRVVSDYYGEQGMRYIDKGSMRPYEVDWKYLWIRPVHAIVAPHPEKKGRVLWIHFAKNVKPLIKRASGLGKK